MDLEQAEKIWEELVEYYGKNLAHPDHEPKRFESQCKIYKYTKWKRDQKSSN